MTAFDNRVEGKLFESLVFRQAQANGLLVMKNHLTCHHTFGGRVQIIKGELDFRLITQDGRIAYVDAKSFEGDKFTFSDLSDHQVERAALYNEWKVASGFIVHFRATKRICFFPGSEIKLAGPRSKFTSNAGTLLGVWSKFDLKMIFD